MAKRAYPATAQAPPVVLFQLGDFFEMFNDDAVRAAALLDIRLTSRPVSGRGRIPMVRLISIFRPVVHRALQLTRNNVGHKRLAFPREVCLIISPAFLALAS